jgi:CheY-like chemotaxis protein
MAARVLLIEDNRPSLELMSYLLHAFGHTPLEAADGIAGLDAMRRERPDLVICDIDLPRLDG